MNREVPSSAELLPQENESDHHGLVELNEVKKIINANVTARGEIVGAADTIEEDEERMAFSDALRWLLQGKKWLQEDENTGKTIEDFMTYKELLYSDKIKNEESIAVQKSLKKDLREFQAACDIIRGGLKRREKEKE